MRKLFFIIGFFLVATGFTKQELINNTDVAVKRSLKTGLTQVKQNQNDLKNKLFEAVKVNDIEQVKFLIEKGANVNWMDWAYNTPLMCASFRGFTEMASLLI
ncbi:MAG: ankyrin repeat domain-containing protein, partial [Elusimicrobiaceae bacterium]|nr:ankyrin repeat domain-containing protein [Elusimicrobiaceae bacterium]